MSSWCYTEIGISVTDDDLVLKQQYMDCLGLLTIDGDTYNHERCSAAGYERDRFLFEEAKKEDDMIFGEDEDFESIPDNLNDIFFLLNLLFPHTYLYCLHYRGSSVSCERECEEVFYDPIKKRIKKEAGGEDYSEVSIPEYCSGGYSSWCDEDVWIRPEEYEEFRRKIREGELESNVDVESLTFEWYGESSESIRFTKPSQEFIKTILEASREKGYTELTALLLEKCKDI